LQAQAQQQQAAQQRRIAQQEQATPIGSEIQPVPMAQPYQTQPSYVPPYQSVTTPNMTPPPMQQAQPQQQPPRCVVLSDGQVVCG
jgi:hypothetical protein